MKLALWDNMEMVGKRMNYKVDYQVCTTGKRKDVNMFPTSRLLSMHFSVMNISV